MLHRVVLSTLLIVSCHPDNAPRHTAAIPPSTISPSVEISMPELGSKDVFEYTAVEIEGWQLLGVYGDDDRLYSALIAAPDNALYAPSLNANPDFGDSFTLLEVDHQGIVVQQGASRFRIPMP